MDATRVEDRRVARGRMLAVVFVSLTVCSLASGQPAPTVLAEIKQAWEARQKRVRTGLLTWKEQRTWPKGAISAVLPPDAGVRIPEAKGKVMPPNDRTVPFLSRLTLDGEKIRFEYEGKEWEHGIQDFRSVRYTSVFDGVTPKYLYPDGVGHATWPVGVIQKGAVYRDASLAALSPLLLVYRPFSRALQPVPIDSLELGLPLMIEGVECMGLIQRLSTKASIHFWVDKSRDFVLVRRMVIDENQPVEQTDIHYNRDSGVGWVPTKWKIVSLNRKRQLLLSIDAEVEKAEFGISSASQSFNLEFPSKTRVLDERTMENYILREDGVKREILSSDLGATYEQMLNSAPGEAKLYRPPLKSRWLLMGLFVVVGGMTLSLLLWRRFRKRPVGC